MVVTNDEQSLELPAILRLPERSLIDGSYEIVGTMDGFFLVKAGSGASLNDRNLVRRFCATIIGSLETANYDLSGSKECVNILNCKIVIIPDD